MNDIESEIIDNGGAQKHVDFANSCVRASNLIDSVCGKADADSAERDLLWDLKQFTLLWLKEYKSAKDVAEEGSCFTNVCKAIEVAFLVGRDGIGKYEDS